MCGPVGVSGCGLQATVEPKSTSKKIPQYLQREEGIAINWQCIEKGASYYLSLLLTYLDNNRIMTMAKQAAKFRDLSIK
jgi:hypothetical protein